MTHSNLRARNRLVSLFRIAKINQPHAYAARNANYRNFDSEWWSAKMSFTKPQISIAAKTPKCRHNPSRDVTFRISEIPISMRRANRLGVKHINRAFGFVVLVSHVYRQAASPGLRARKRAQLRPAPLGGCASQMKHICY